MKNIIVPDGTILLHKITKKYLKSCKWYAKIVTVTICIFTWSKYHHTSFFSKGYRYESGHPFGVVKKKAVFEEKEGYKYKYPIRPMTKEEADRYNASWEKKLKQNIRYNYLKLGSMTFVYPTRFFWDKLKYVPFQNNYFFGVVCSVAGCESFGDIGWILLPGRYNETIVPGDLDKSVMHKDEL